MSLDLSLCQNSRRVAFITGAARGIGLAIALRLSQDGLDVAINDIPAHKAQLEVTAKQIEAAGGKCAVVVGDVSDEATVESMVAQVVQKLGSLDVMVANAGIMKVKSFLETTADELDLIHSVNVRGVFLCYKYAAKQMIKQGRGGKLIAASSVAGMQARKSYIPYCTSKFAVRGLNQGVAMELAPHNITANCYCPGLAETDMHRMMIEKLHELRGVPVDELIDNISKLVPLGRTSSSDEVAKLVSFLASMNSDYITGQSILVDGGIFMT